VDTATVQSLHGALSRTWVVKFHETVVVALAVELLRKLAVTHRHKRQRKYHFSKLISEKGQIIPPPNATHILVRDYLDAKHVAGGFEDLLKDVLRDPGVQTTDVEGSLVGLGRSTTNISSSASGRHHAAGHGRSHGSGDRVGVLWDDHRRPRGRRHVRRVGLAIALGAIVLLVLSTSSRLGNRRQRGRGRSRSVFSHRVQA